jgi:GMP synthase-like glutamine amidotransferase
MRVLSIVHDGDAGTELFGPVTAGAGHDLEEWSFAEQGAPELDAYGAVLVFGGFQHPDQDDAYPWLADEADWLPALVERRVPTLGICLGAELVARASGAWVGRMPEPEIGWGEVVLTEAAATDPVFSTLPERFDGLLWHHYAHDLPDGAVALAHSAASLQAFRLGETCWGIQFHPEVTEPQLGRWIADEGDPPPDRERLQVETRQQIGRWNELGRRLCRAFLGTAERRAD